MASTLSNISLILLVASGVLFVTAVLIFIVMRIPTVISDLSGRTARKAIEKMRSANIKKGPSSNNYSNKGSSNAVIKDEPFDKEYKKEKQKETLKEKKEKELLEKKKAEKKNLKQKLNIGNKYAETGIIGDNKQNGVSMAAETELLQSNETELLESNETLPLDYVEEKPETQVRKGVSMQMIDEITLVDSDEVIE